MHKKLKNSQGLIVCFCCCCCCCCCFVCFYIWLLQSVWGCAAHSITMAPLRQRALLGTFYHMVKGVLEYWMSYELSGATMWYRDPIVVKKKNRIKTGSLVQSQILYIYIHKTPFYKHHKRSSLWTYLVTGGPILIGLAISTLTYFHYANMSK